MNMTIDEARTITLPFGAHAGETLLQIIESGDGQYLDWLSKRKPYKGVTHSEGARLRAGINLIVDHYAADVAASIARRAKK